MKRIVLTLAVAFAVAGCKTGEDKTADLSGGERPATQAAAPEATGSPFGRPGFTVVPAADNRIWVFRDGSKEIEELRKHGELVKFVTRPGAGPGRMTVRAPDGDTILAYAAAREGFSTSVREGRIWVFRPGSKELAEFEKSGEPAKSVTRIGAGPLGMTVKGPDPDTITEYLCSKRGFVVACEDGRLWLFRAGSKELAEFEKQGELGSP
jgi:hypothetical protein